MHCRHSKQRVIYEGHQRITGLAFKLVGKNQVLFVATEGEVICITLLPKDKEHKVCCCSSVNSQFTHSATLIGCSNAPGVCVCVCVAW